MILGVRVTGVGASERRPVTDLAVPRAVRVAPETSRVTANASMVTSGPQTIGTARVMSVNPDGRRLTVVDSMGATRVLDVRGDAVASLARCSRATRPRWPPRRRLMNGTPRHGQRDQHRYHRNAAGALGTADTGRAGPTGMQPVPGAQPCSGTGVTDSRPPTPAWHR